MPAGALYTTGLSVKAIEKQSGLSPLATSSLVCENTLTSIWDPLVGGARVDSLPSVLHPRLRFAAIKAVVTQGSRRGLLGGGIGSFGAVGFGAQISARDGCGCNGC